MSSTLRVGLGECDVTTDGHMIGEHGSAVFMVKVEDELTGMFNEPSRPAA